MGGVVSIGWMEDLQYSGENQCRNLVKSMMTTKVILNFRAFPGKKTNSDTQQGSFEGDS